METVVSCCTEIKQTAKKGKTTHQA